MIIIHNIGGDLEGECEYIIRINKRQIASFKHNRPDGLAICLEKAAKAVRDADVTYIKELAILLSDRKNQ